MRHTDPFSEERVEISAELFFNSETFRDPLTTAVELNSSSAPPAMRCLAMAEKFIEGTGGSIE